MGILGALGSLNVLFSCDTTTFTTAMDKAAFVAERDFRRITGAGKLTMAAFSAAAVATSAALAVSVKKAIDHADQLGEMSQAIGLTAEQLSSLEYAAKMSGLSIDDLSTSFRKFNKMIYDGATGSKESADAFKSLGVSLTDSSGRLKNNYTLFLESADALSKMSDGAQKSALAQELFGKSGANMIPIINEGKDGIKKLADEAARFGVVVSSETVAASDKFNDNMTRIASISQGLVNHFTAGLIPTISNLSDNISTSADTLERFQKAGKATAETLVVIANASMIVIDSFKTLGDSVAAGALQIALISTGQFQKAADVLHNYADDQEKRWAELVANVDKNWQAISDHATNTSDNLKKVSTDAEKNQKIIEKNTEAAKALKKAGDGIGQAFGTAFENAIIEGMKFRDIMMSLLQDIERALIRSLITDNIAKGVSWGISSFFPQANPSPGATKSAHGNVFERGSVVPFASGGLVTRPTLFPMANGGTGLAGEAGTEAIMPLFRTPSGDLGVKSGGGRVEVNVYAPAGSKVSQSRQQSGDMEQINIMIDEAVAGSVNNPGSKTHRALKTSFGLRQSLTTR